MSYHNALKGEGNGRYGPIDSYPATGDKYR